MGDSIRESDCNCSLSITSSVTSCHKFVSINHVSENNIGIEFSATKANIPNTYNFSEALFVKEFALLYGI